MSEDVDFVNVGGDWLKGKADFELNHFRLLSGRFIESTITPLEIVVRFLRPDLAVLHRSWSCIGVGASEGIGMKAGPNPELKGIKPPIIFPNIGHKHSR